MSTIPQEALDAAAARLAAIDGKGAADPEHIRCASLILLDAQPHIEAGERERCAKAIRQHVSELQGLRLSADPVTAAHLDGLRVAAAFLEDGMR